MNIYISLGLLALGVILIFSKDTLLSKDTQTPMLKMLYENALYVGIGCVAIAYFVYIRQPTVKLQTNEQRSYKSNSISSASQPQSGTVESLEQLSSSST